MYFTGHGDNASEIWYSNPMHTAINRRQSNVSHVYVNYLVGDFTKNSATKLLKRQGSISDEYLGIK